MGFKKIILYLTPEQEAAINDCVGGNGEPFSLHAQPRVREMAAGEAGELCVYVLSRAQTEMVNPAIVAARNLPEWGGDD